MFQCSVRVLVPSGRRPLAPVYTGRPPSWVYVGSKQTGDSTSLDSPQAGKADRACVGAELIREADPGMHWLICSIQMEIYEQAL